MGKALKRGGKRYRIKMKRPPKPDKKQKRKMKKDAHVLMNMLYSPKASPNAIFCKYACCWKSKS